MLVGGGGGFGLSPFLGTTFATGSHFDATPNVSLLEVVNLQGFALWVGPRVSAGILSENGGPKAAALTIDYLMLRYVASW